ncbi:hypothetical protein Mal64_27790 [Pseudobythopirellula maris]|uniref:2-oxoadipate dioxygenase/decarboxylase n=1 Tax=Pseudobythopirellula maris TaxID=2527991 RepID=A0A5C5ZKD0_9BACT|nr:DUF1338 domain-containing protein [Pseudobythopirellula maris]TWT87241.1 hypothetical protein Mal64_27790 [Pseudobythopirellula maris]
MDTTEFFEKLWADYVAMTPQAEKIRKAFVDRGERVVNDHVAFRTLNLAPINLAALEPHVLALGYERFQPYSFPAKKLKAFGYVHPDPELPRVFLSELLVEELSDEAGAILRRCAEQVDASKVSDPSVLWSGRLWEPVSWAEWQALQEESEYAAWVASLGIRPNHFTIAVNYLEKYPEVEDVLRVVEELGYGVNDSGGRVKGKPEVLLEQGSTMADRLTMPFAGGEEHAVPTCYYEFAKRYPDAEGNLFQGFVAASADKIFESTDAGKTS